MQTQIQKKIRTQETHTETFWEKNLKNNNLEKEDEILLLKKEGNLCKRN